MTHETFFTACDPDEITAIDLRKELDNVIDYRIIVETYRLARFGKDGLLNPVTGSMLWFPDFGRAGIEWGADAAWTDASSPDDAVRRYTEDDLIP